MPMFMDEYEAWGDAEKNHAAQAFPTTTLREMEKLLPPNIRNSAETGCGKSTILFSNISNHHNVFAYDDRELGDQSSVLFYERCPLSRLEVINCVFGPTQETLRHYQHHIPYDVVLIDGPHGFPFPDLEYFFFYPHIVSGGILIVDDVSIPTIARLADIIAEDDMFELVAVVGNNTALFRRTTAPTFSPTGDGWWTQKYNRRRVSPKRDIYLDDGPVVDKVSTLQVDRLLYR
jgi:hypothetical protein